MVDGQGDSGAAGTVVQSLRNKRTRTITVVKSPADSIEPTTYHVSPDGPYRHENDRQASRAAETTLQSLETMKLRAFNVLPFPAD